MLLLSKCALYKCYSHVITACFVYSCFFTNWGMYSRSSVQHFNNTVCSTQGSEHLSLFSFSICCMQRTLQFELLFVFLNMLSHFSFKEVLLIQYVCCFYHAACSGSQISFIDVERLKQTKIDKQHKENMMLPFHFGLYFLLNWIFFILYILLVGGLGIFIYFLLLMDFLVCFWLGKLSLYLDSSPSLFILFYPYFFLFLFFSRRQHSNEKLSTFLFNRQFTPWWDMLSLIFLWHSSI